MTKTTDGFGAAAVIGKPIDRVDGRLKVTGKARYAAEWPIENLAYAHVIQSTVPKGVITKFDTSVAEKVPGVIAVYSYLNKPGIISHKAKEFADRLFLLQDSKVSYAGQIIGLVVADTLESAKQASASVKISYATEPFVTDFHSKDRQVIVADGHDLNIRGNLDKGLAQSSVRIDATYSTPTETHNPMEPFATIAVWDGDELTLYDSTQGVVPTQNTVAKILSMPPNKVRVISPFVGGGFGCKLTVWSHVPLAAMAARKLGRPVKVVLDRNQMYGPVGSRPATIQKVTLGASQEGKLLAIRHVGTSPTAQFTHFVENVIEPTKSLYACDNVQTGLHVVPLDIGPPTWMRAPGHATGSFALECAIDELACKLKICPIELRLRNWSDKEADSQLPWSSNALRECYERGSKLFDWEKRKATPGAVRNGNLLIGYGMAAAQHSVWRNPASVEVKLLADGNAIVSCATQDIGTGTYTVMTQVAAESLGLPVGNVKFVLGDSTLPAGPTSGGSTTAGSVGSAVANACSTLIDTLISMAISDPKSPLYRSKAAATTVSHGRLHLKESPSTGELFSAIVGRRKDKVVSIKVDNRPGNEENKYAMSSFGAQFAEVHVDAKLGRIYVNRFVGVYDVGRVLNPKTARSQALGGITFGIGMALLEHTWMDNNLGRIINADLAEYHVPVHPDIGSIEVDFVQPDDRKVNSIGVKGLGEVGITGAAAAIANAVFNATGKRIRDLPITLDTLL